MAQIIFDLISIFEDMKVKICSYSFYIANEVLKSYRFSLDLLKNSDVKDDKESYNLCKYYVQTIDNTLKKIENPCLNIVNKCLFKM